MRPLSILIPLLGLLAGLFWVKHNLHRDPGRPAQPPQQASLSEVPGWRASLPWSGGGRLELVLSPLHAEGARQRFDATALERRLGLGSGEAWRLNLELRGSGAGAGGGDGGAADELALDEVRVVDREGEALRLHRLDSAASSPNRPADPVAVLFGPPAEALRSGQAVSLMLWGRPPGEGARVLGVGGQPIEMVASGVAREELSRSLIQVARREPGVGMPAEVDEPPDRSGENEE